LPLAAEGNLNPQRPKKCLRTTQSPSERAGISWPAGAPICHIVTGKLGGGTQEV
jgi:hypothetical protein